MALENKFTETYTYQLFVKIVPYSERYTSILF